MGTQHEILTGARAKFIVNGRVVGLFTSCSYGVEYDIAPAYILGRYSPAELTYVSQSVISVDATGFRVIDGGAHVSAEVPKLQELLNHEDISLAIVDRESNKTIMTVVGVRPVGYSTSIGARGQVEISVRFLGLRLEDESGTQNESAGANDLLTGVR